MTPQKDSYGDEMAAQVRQALGRFELEKKTNPKAAARNFVKSIRRAPPGSKGGRPRSPMMDQAEKLYEKAISSGASPNWAKITAAVDPSFEDLRTDLHRKRRVNQVSSAVHSRRSRKNR